MAYDHGRDEMLVQQLLAQHDQVENADAAAGLADVPDAAGIVAGGRIELEALARHLFARCRTAAMVDETYRALVAAIRVRQPSPAISPANEILRYEARLIRFNYRGEEIDELRRVLEINERLVTILPRTVESDRRVIDRKSLIGPRMAYFTNHAWELWLARFPSEAELADLDRRVEDERRAVEAARQSAERSAHDAQIAREQLAASRQRQIEAAEDALLATVKRAEARQKGVLN